MEALATAFANKVLPHPGGPYNSTPAGEVILNYAKRSGSTIGNIILLRNSSLRDTRPPMSSQVTFGMAAKPSLLPVGYTSRIAPSKSVCVTSNIIYVSCSLSASTGAYYYYYSSILQATAGA